MGETTKTYEDTTLQNWCHKRAFDQPRGITAHSELMNHLDLANHIDAIFPQPGSNRGFKPSVFIETLILMQHAGGFHL